MLVEGELLREATLVDDSRRLVAIALLQQRLRQEPDAVRPGDAHAVRDAEIERLPQICHRSSKIAALRLMLAAPHQRRTQRWGCRRDGEPEQPPG